MLLGALLIGIVAGLRTMTALAAASWAATLHHPDLEGTWLAFLGWRFTAPILTLLALGEFVADQLPSTPSREVPVQFAARIVSGAVSGAVIGHAANAWGAGLALGAVGAVIGTIGGAAARSWLATRLGKDRPAALVEDGIAVALAAAIVLGL